jgi:hypothetical protein
MPNHHQGSWHAKRHSGKRPLLSQLNEVSFEEPTIWSQELSFVRHQVGLGRDERGRIFDIALLLRARAPGRIVGRPDWDVHACFVRRLVRTRKRVAGAHGEHWHGSLTESVRPPLAQRNPSHATSRLGWHRANRPAIALTDVNLGRVQPREGSPGHWSAGQVSSDNCSGNSTSHNQSVSAHVRIEATTSRSVFPAAQSIVSRPGL